MRKNHTLLYLNQQKEGEINERHMVRQKTYKLPQRNTNYNKEINSMEGYQNSQTIPSTIPSSLFFCTTHACKPINYAERRIEAASFPSTTTSPNITTPNLYPKFISAPDWLSKWACFSNPAKPADTPQPLPELFSNYKPIHQLRPQSNIYGKKDSIPKTMESFQQTKLNVPRNVPQSPRKATSRRLAQQRKQRLMKKDAFKRDHNNVGTARKSHTEQYCLRNFGFCANPALSKSKNFKLALHENPLRPWLQPKNLAFHNLCKTQKLPLGTKELLGLNLKFCLSCSKITNDIKNTMLQIAKSIWTRHFLQTDGTTENNTYEKQIYIKNTSWNPPPAPLHVEDKITEFDKTLKFLHQRLSEKHNHKKLTNFTPFQVKP